MVNYHYHIWRHWEENQTQGIRRHSLVTQDVPPLAGAPPEIPKGTLHPTIPSNESGREMGKHNPPHDIEDPEDSRRLLRTKIRIRSQGCLRPLTLCRWWLVPTLLRSRQQHHQDDWPLVQRLDSQVPLFAGRSTHEEFLVAHAHAWQLFLSSVPGVGALLLIFTFLLLIIPPVLFDHLPNLWPMAHGDSDTPHGSKLAAERWTQTKEIV